MKSNNDPVLTLSIRRPIFQRSGKTERIERYFSKLTEKWQARWETDLYSEACKAYADSRAQGSIFVPWQATLDYTITLWQQPLLSIRLDIQEHGPAPLPCTLCIGEVWDCSTGYPCSLRSFLPATPRRWKREIIRQLSKQAQSQLDSGESLLRPNCFSDIKNKFDAERYYLTENEIVIYYPLYVLGAYGEGIPSFTLPISEEIQSNKLRALSITARR